MKDLGYITSPEAIHSCIYKNVLGFEFPTTIYDAEIKSSVMETFTENLQSKYGYIYDLLCSLSLCSCSLFHQTLQDNNWKENRIWMYLLDNPVHIFKTKNRDTIHNFLDFFRSHEETFRMNHPQKYKKFQKATREWKIKREGILSKPVISKICSYLSFTDLESISRIPQLDTEGFWKEKLEYLNDRDIANYQILLDIKDKKETVLTVMGVQEITLDMEKLVQTYKTLSVRIQYVYQSKILHVEEISRKPFKVFAKVLPYLIHLEELYIFHVDIDIDKGLYHDKLKKLHIYGPRRPLTFPPRLLENLPNLEFLHIEGCNLGNFPGGVFKNLCRLKTLIMINDNITSLSKDAFIGLDNLEQLHLNDNNIKTLPPDIFMSLPKLKTLSLAANKLYIKTLQALKMPHKDIAMSW